MSPKPEQQSYRPQRGFTLVEIIVGIVITGISLAVVTTLIYPLFVRSVDPMLQIRAAEYAQAIIQDIASKPYDALTPQGGQPPCSPCSTIGPDGASSREQFNDVDDFDYYCSGGPLAGVAWGVVDVLGNDLSSGEYSGFSFTACVSYAGVDFGLADENAKRVVVTVTPPAPASAVVISAYRGNY